MKNKFCLYKYKMFAFFIIEFKNYMKTKKCLDIKLKDKF